MLLLRSNLPAASVVLYHRSDINLQLLEYWKISLGERQAEAQRFVRYGLYAYSEGQFTEKIRKMIFRGIPVLFIPGNTGSYKQVRSLASVSLREAISCHSPYYFDFFAVDLNKEHSALYGGILNEQTQFVHLSIKKILQLYVNVSNPPKSVILVGHSMMPHGSHMAMFVYIWRKDTKYDLRVDLKQGLKKVPSSREWTIGLSKLIVMWDVKPLKL